MGLSYTGLYDDALFSGLASSAETVGLFDVAIAGRAYLVDRLHDLSGLRNGYNRTESLPVLREQSDQSDHPGEATLNPAGLWRRAQESWHHGSGQSYLDRDKSTSDLNRFHSSKGIDWSTQWQAALLPDTSNQLVSVNPNLKSVVAGSFLYVIDGQALKFTSTAPTSALVWTTVTGTPAVTATDLTSDGNTVYAAYGASGIYTTTRGAASASSFVTGTVAVCSYQKGRLLAASANVLWEVRGTGATGSANVPVLLTHTNSDFTWNSFAGGPNAIYAGGTSGVSSLIYRTAVVTDGTALAAPLVAGELPTGETLSALRGYFGFLALGTSLGLRLASLSSSGDLTLGALIPTTSPVSALSANDRFIFYGLSNYDTASTGLGRADLSVFIAALAPAYGSDLMATGQGTVSSVHTYQNTRIFTVASLGVFVATSSLVSSGTLSGGAITYGIADAKVALFADIRHLALPTGASVSAALSTDGGSGVTIGTSNVSGTTAPAAFSCAAARGEHHELTLTLTRGTDPTMGPTLSRVTLRSHPAPDRLNMHTVPILLHELVEAEGVIRAYDIADELAALYGLRDAGDVVTYQDGAEACSVIILDTNFVKASRTTDNQHWNGTLVLTLKQVI